MAMGRSLSRTPSTRSRRHSTVSFANYGYGAPSTVHVKFKRKNSFSNGIGLDEAQQRILKLSNNDAYSFHDLHADSHRRIYIKIKVVPVALRFFILLIPPSDYSGLVTQPLHTRFPLRGMIVSTCRHWQEGFPELAFIIFRYVVARSRSFMILTYGHCAQANVIPVPWDRVILHHLEEIQYGVWQPMLTMR
jgi:hypothetical protein